MYMHLAKIYLNIVIILHILYYIHIYNVRVYMYIT